MAFDLNRSFGSITVQKDVALGQVVEREGVLLRGLLQNGVEVVQKADALAATYQLVGFAISDNQSYAIMPAVETAVVPAAPGPYTITLANNNLVGVVPLAQMIVRTAAGAVCTQVAGAPALVVPPQYQPVAASGIITFNAGNAGLVVTITYRYNMTVAQSVQRYYMRNVNNQSGAIFNTVAVMSGVGEIWTYEYDAIIDWSVVAPILSGADGILTVGGGGTALAGARVIHVPDGVNAALGVAFSFAP